jgi:hypothetical protein
LRRDQPLGRKCVARSDGIWFGGSHTQSYRSIIRQKSCLSLSCICGKIQLIGKSVCLIANPEFCFLVRSALRVKSSAVPSTFIIQHSPFRVFRFHVPHPTRTIGLSTFNLQFFRVPRPIKSN